MVRGYGNKNHVILILVYKRSSVFDSNLQNSNKQMIIYSIVNKQPNDNSLFHTYVKRILGKFKKPQSILTQCTASHLSCIY